MRCAQPSFTLDVDIINPGQVIACCGLLELAHRIWPGAEGWFAGSRFSVAVHGKGDSALADLVQALAGCELSGLSQEERNQRDELETKKRGQKLSADEEKRRKDLGEQARAGAIRVGEPFVVLLDWWCTDDRENVPKTWAGRQELHRIARAAQDALSSVDPPTIMDCSCVLRVPEEYRTGKSDHKEKVEPFYFDARRLAHPRDAGFSLDKQKAECISYPAVELLCLIGLQRFRPTAAPQKGAFDYWIWSRPLSAPLASAVFSGACPIPGGQTYRFALRFRDDQKRYKAFGLAT